MNFLQMMLVLIAGIVVLAGVMLVVFLQNPISTTILVNEVQKRHQKKGQKSNKKG